MKGVCFKVMHGKSIGIKIWSTEPQKGFGLVVHDFDFFFFFGGVK